jgi:hypothetical protein
LHSLLPRLRWSRLTQPRRRPSAWSVGNHDGKDAAWVGKCGVQAVVPRGLPGALSVAE